MFDELIANVEADLRKAARSCALWKEMAASRPELFAVIEDFIFSGGKRLRPTFFYIAYEGYANRPAQPFANIALALELLHNFILVHDDIIDKASSRRGRPALHRAFTDISSSLGHPRVSGEDLALIVGDLMHALALRLFMDVDVQLERRQAAVELLTDVVTKTAQGELEEVLMTGQSLSATNAKAILTVYDQKTGDYTFRCPLTLGAIYAGRDDEEKAQIEHLSVPLGRAYQIKNDLMEIHQFMNNPYDGIPDDFMERKRTFPAMLAWENSTAPDRERLDNLFKIPTMTLENAQEILNIFQKTEALNQSRDCIVTCKDQALAALDELTLDEMGRKRLAEFIKKALDASALSSEPLSCSS